MSHIVNENPAVHEFDDSGEAYDALQCDDNIKEGDVLVVRSERVVGVAVEAWPVAVTTEWGAFHGTKSKWDWSKVSNSGGLEMDYGVSHALAVRLALEVEAAPVAGPSA
jgi:hypothetical protein